MKAGFAGWAPPRFDRPPATARYVLNAQRHEGHLLAIVIGSIAAADALNDEPGRVVWATGSVEKHRPPRPVITSGFEKVSDTRMCLDSSPRPRLSPSSMPLGNTVTPPRGASDAFLLPHHVERGKIFVRERF